jgi:branched-chain amino acid transport system permease protein
MNGNYYFESDLKGGSWKDRIGAIGFTPLGLFLMILLALAPLFLRDEFILRLLISAMMFAGLAVAFDFTAGFISINNFGFAAFWGFGAYVSGILVARLGWSPWITMPLAAVGAGVVGFIMGLLTIRLGGIYAACMTWFLALAMVSTAGSLVWLTHGYAGMSVPALFETVRNWPYFYLIFGMLLAVYILITVIVKTRLGMAFRAIGQDLEAAASSGVDAVKYKVLNFTISCTFAGLIGGFYAHFIGILTPSVMATSHTVEILAIAYIGGRGTIWGALVSAMLLVPVMEFLKDLMEFRLILYGALMIVVMIYYPKGLVGVYESIERLFKKRNVEESLTSK